MAHRRHLANEQTRNFANNVLICNDDQLERMRREASALAGMGTAFQQLLDLNFVALEENREAFK